MPSLFATVINCMDGRVQLKVNEYVANTYHTPYVDTITLAGPSKVISENQKQTILENLKFRLDISIHNHKSEYIAIVGHADCAGVPESDDVQIQYILDSAKKIQEWYPTVRVEALWLNSDFELENITQVDDK